MFGVYYNAMISKTIFNLENYSKHTAVFYSSVLNQYNINNKCYNNF